MFDVSFLELLVIAVVALLVIGPEKLPKVARTVGALTGRMQRYVAQVKDEINRESRFEELQKLQQEIKQSVEQEATALRGSIYEASGDAKLKPTLKTAAKKLKSPAKKVTSPTATKTKTTKSATVKVKTVKAK